MARNRAPAVTVAPRSRAASSIARDRRLPSAIQASARPPGGVKSSRLAPSSPKISMRVTAAIRVRRHPSPGVDVAQEVARSAAQARRRGCRTLRDRARGAARRFRARAPSSAQAAAKASPTAPPADHDDPAPAGAAGLHERRSLTARTPRGSSGPPAAAGPAAARSSRRERDAPAPRRQAAIVHEGAHEEVGERDAAPGIAPARPAIGFEDRRRRRDRPKDRPAGSTRARRRRAAPRSAPARRSGCIACAALPAITVRSAIVELMVRSFSGNDARGPAATKRPARSPKCACNSREERAVVQGEDARGLGRRRRPHERIAIAPPAARPPARGA